MFLILWLAGVAVAQPLDLRVRPVTDGVVHSIREVQLSPQAGPKGGVPPAVGAPSDLEENPPVGAVVSRPFGGSSSDKKWQFGAAGTPEMQARLANTGFELLVKMDDGERRAFRVRDVSRFRIGQRVTVRSGEPEPLDI